MKRYRLFTRFPSITHQDYLLSPQQKFKYSEIVMQFLNHKFPLASLYKDEFDLEANYSLTFYNDEISQKYNHDLTEFLKTQLIGHIIKDDTQLIPTLTFKIKAAELIRFIDVIKKLTPKLGEEIRATLGV